MNQKLIAGLGGLVVLAALTGWFVWFRHKDAATATPPDHTRSAKIEPPAAPAPKSDAPAPRGVAPKWELDRDPEGPLRLEGQVLGPDGSGLGGAVVWLGSVPPRTVKTEGDGTFAFDKLVGRSYALTASSGDLIGGPVTHQLAATSDPVVIRLSEGATLVVDVVDDAGHPVAAADVKLAGESDLTTKTDDKGMAKLKPVRPGWVMVEVNAAGYALGTNFTTLGSAGASGEISVTLHKGMPVSGRVIDDAGKPIAKAHVSAGDGSPWSLGRDADEVETDAKGQFAFVALGAGSHVLSAVDGEHAPAESSPITVSATRAVTGIEITMKAGGVVSGVVVDHDAKPVAFATVRIAGTGAQMWQVASRQATSDAKGAFELRGLGRAKLQARAESDAAASKLVDVDLSAKSAVRDVKLVLDVAGTISGVVVDDKNQPVAEVQVNAFPDVLAGAATEGLALAGMSSATTDGGGNFTLHGLPDGGYRLWAARSTGMNDGWGMQSTPAKTGDKAVRIVLPAPGGLTGKIVLEGGKPPSLANVQAGAHPATPAPGGVFTLKDLAPGTYDVTLHGPEFAEYVKHDVEVKPGAVTDLGTITVPRGRSLAGRVVDGSGTPVAGARIKLGEMLFSASGVDDAKAASFEDMSGIRSAVSDQDGHFVIVGVPKKATTVMADHPDRGQSLATPVAEGTDDPPPITLALRGYGSIVGKVTMKGEPQSNVTISESSKGGGAQASFTQTTADGAFAMAKVPEGVHVLNAMQSQMMAMKSTSVTVVVVAGKQANVTIDIPVGQITVAVQLKALPNNKLDAAQVFLFRGVVTAQNAKQLGDGFFQGGVQGMKFWFGADKPAPEFDELVPGDYTICSVPITGNLADPTFQQRLQENMQTLKVYCKQTKVAASPLKQTATQELPAMTPLPEPTH
jgi:uncharacterized GH25 family protein